jgi:hypothetical protein
MHGARPIALRRTRRWESALYAAVAVIAVGSQVMASTIDVTREETTTNYRDEANLTADTVIAHNQSVGTTSMLLPGHEMKDWVKWGNTSTWTNGTYDDALLSAANGGDHKNGGTGQISTVLTKIVTGTDFRARQNNGLIFHKWTDGLCLNPRYFTGRAICRVLVNDEGC